MGIGAFKWLRLRSHPHPHPRSRSRVVPVRRRGAAAYVLPWLWRHGPALALGGCALALAIWIYVSGAALAWAALARYTAQAGFRVEKILVEGRIHADADQLRALTEADRGMPLIAFDPAGVRERLKSVAWIKSAAVMRQWPDTIRIVLTERVPIALWQSGKMISIVGDDGMLIPLTARQWSAMTKSLITVMGKDAPAHTPALMDIMAAWPELKRTVATGRFIDGRRWDIELSDKLVLQLPEAGAPEALQRLRAQGPLSEITLRGGVAVDMRTPPDIFIKLSPHAQQAIKAAQDSALLSSGDAAQ